MAKTYQRDHGESIPIRGQLLLICGLLCHIVNFVLYAPTLVGTAYLVGWGVSRDFTAAAKWYRRSAEWGYADAQSNLGNLYTAGLGVPRDFVEAAKWLRLAAEKGHTEAQTRLAQLLAQGEGVPQDSEEALKWLRLAAAQGHGEALATLGSIYMHGVGTPINYAEALEWLEKQTSDGGLACKNCLAWLLATCPDDNIRDGSRALTLAKDVVAKDASPENLDTLAAAYAAVGDFDEAARVQRQVIAVTEKSGGASFSDTVDYRQRLRAYEMRQPWRKP